MPTLLLRAATVSLLLIPTTVSLGVIAALLGGGIGLSLLERRRESASS